MEDEPPRKRGRPITRQEDWEASQKRIRLSTSTFERWRELKNALALASDDAVASYLLDFLALHVRRDECSTPVPKEPDAEPGDESSSPSEPANYQLTTLSSNVDGRSQQDDSTRYLAR